MFKFKSFAVAAAVFISLFAFAGCATDGDGSGGGVSSSSNVSINISALPKGPVVLFTEQIGKMDTTERSWPTVSLKLKSGENEPETLIDSIGGVGEYPLAFEFSPDNNSIFINLESKLLIYDLASHKLRDFYKPQKSVSNFIFSPDGKRVMVVDQVYGSLDSPATFVDVNIADGKATTVLEDDAKEKFFSLVKWRDDDTVLLFETLGGAAIPFTLDISAKTLQPVPGYSEAALYYGFSDHGKYLYTASKTGEDICNDYSGINVSAYDLVDPVTGEKIAQVGSDGRFISILAFSPDDSKVLYMDWAPATNKNACDEDTAYSYWQVDLSSGSKVEVEDYKAVVQQWYPENTDMVLEQLSNGYMVYYKGSPYFSTSGMQQLYKAFNNL